MASGTVLRNNIVSAFPTRTPLLGKGQGHDPSSGVSFPHTKWFQSVENGVNASLQIVGTAPVSSTSFGVPGSVAFDANFLYYCYAANSWRRIAGSAF